MLLSQCSKRGSSASSPPIISTHLPDWSQPAALLIHASQHPAAHTCGRAGRLVSIAESCFVKAALLARHPASYPAKAGAFLLQGPGWSGSTGDLWGCRSAAAGWHWQPHGAWAGHGGLLPHEEISQVSGMRGPKMWRRALAFCVSQQSADLLFCGKSEYFRACALTVNETGSALSAPRDERFW